MKTFKTITKAFVFVYKNFDGENNREKIISALVDKSICKAGGLILIIDKYNILG